MNFYQLIKTKLQSDYPSKVIEGICVGIIAEPKIAIMLDHYLTNEYIGLSQQPIAEIVKVGIYANSYTEGCVLAESVVSNLKSSGKIVNALISVYSHVLEKYVLEFSIKGEN